MSRNFRELAEHFRIKTKITPRKLCTLYCVLWERVVPKR